MFFIFFSTVAKSEKLLKWRKNGLLVFSLVMFQFHGPKVLEIGKRALRISKSEGEPVLFLLVIKYIYK